MVAGRWPCPGKIWKQWSTPCENSRAVQISPHNSGSVIDSEKSSINANRKSAMRFPTSHQPRSCVTHNFPKMWFIVPKFDVFRKNFEKTLKVCYKVSLSKTFSDKVVTWSTIERYKHFGRGWPHSRKIWAQRHRPQQEGCVFHVSHAERCAVGVSRPSCCACYTLTSLKHL